MSAYHQLIRRRRTAGRFDAAFVASVGVIAGVLVQLAF
jgi:hypothetical protein